MMRQVCNALLIASLTILTGCDPLSLTALGVGAGAGINHTVNGYTYHTFSEALPRVKQAALVALKRMSIKVESTEKNGVFETINAKSSGRSIELELEVISPKVTRLRSVARKNPFVMDSATAEEVIAQTRRALKG
ncbi:DUF3568 family protein [Sulfuricella sp.]|uniref:DUF3568 family protein n=1 Tax=Sulfuricella sp. TaxID=2099377 RepID=UPI002CC97468|nr:DUF3568 family protein [Sulfuricella sp.]HUX64213.1 DUF3568 family protein [Sulfuricella sp.]